MDIQFLGGRGGKSNKKPKGELIRGISQEQIDKLRGLFENTIESGDVLKLLERVYQLA